jgi:ribosomal protein L29
MSGETLQEQLEGYRKKLFALYNEKAVSKKVDKPHLFKAYRKSIASCLTKIRAQSLNGEPNEQ